MVRTPPEVTQQTYELVLSLIQSQHPGRVLLNLDEVAQVMTSHLGYEHSKEMVRRYAKSGQLIQGLRKSPKGMWLFPIPALAWSLATGLIVTEEEPPTAVRELFGNIQARSQSAPVSPRRGGRPPASSKRIAFVEGWMEIYRGNDVLTVYHWQADRIAETTHSTDQLGKPERQQLQRHQDAWMALQKQIDWLEGLELAQQRDGALNKKLSAKPGQSRNHS